jgi:pentatricopeptide repeat protein
VNAAIGACERKGGLWEKAVELFDSMARLGLDPNTITFNSVIRACANCGQWEKAANLLESMLARGLKPSHTALSAVIRECNASGQSEKAAEFSSRIVR